MYPTVMQEIVRQQMQAQREEAAAWRRSAGWRRAARWRAGQRAPECYPQVPIPESAEVADYAAAQRTPRYSGTRR